MIEQLRKQYYWGCVDKKIYKFDYDDYIATICKLKKISLLNDIDEILGDSFSGCGDIYALSKEIIFDYISGEGEFLKHKNVFSGLPVEKCEWYHWDLLRRVFGGINAQYYSGLCRDEEVRLLNELPNSNQELKLRKYSVYASEGDIKNAELLIESINSGELKKQWIERYEQLMDYHETIFHGRKIRDEYGKYLEGKKVVIVGVAPHFCSAEKEDDTVYVFMNYAGKNKISIYDYNLPTNISYYNVHLAQKATKENALYLNDLDYMVCKTQMENIGELHKYNSKIRVASPLMFGCPFGSPLMVPIILFDLLHYGVRDIHITNTDLYSTSSKYYSGYYDGDSTRNLIRDLPIHDLVGNWRLMKTWYGSGLFSCDDSLNSVLEMNQEQYTKKVEESFFADLIKHKTE